MVDIARALAEAMGDRDGDYLTIENQWGSVTIAKDGGGFHVSPDCGADGWTASAEIAFAEAMGKLHELEQGRCD